MSAGLSHDGGLDLHLDDLVVDGDLVGYADSVIDLGNGGEEDNQPSQTMSRTDRCRVS